MSDIGKTVNDALTGFSQVVNQCLAARPKKTKTRMVTIRTTTVTFDVVEAQEALSRLFSGLTKTFGQKVGAGLGQAFAQQAASTAPTDDHDGHHCHDCGTPMTFAERVRAVDEEMLGKTIRENLKDIEVKVPGGDDQGTMLTPQGLHTLASQLVYHAMTPEDVILMLDPASDNYTTLSDLVTNHVPEQHRIQVLKAIIAVCQERRNKIDETKS